MIIQALSSMVTILAVIALGYLLQAKGWFQEGFSKSIFVDYGDSRVHRGMGRCSFVQSSGWKTRGDAQYIRECEHRLYGIAAEPLSFWRRSDAVFFGLLRD